MLMVLLLLDGRHCQQHHRLPRASATDVPLLLPTAECMATSNVHLEVVLCR